MAGSVEADPRIGTEIAGYRIERMLGRGGMSVVYLAEHLRLKRKVALKLLNPELAEDEGFRERFLRESELAASLDHPNIIPVYDADETGSLLYIAMHYVEGSKRPREAPRRRGSFGTCGGAINPGSGCRRAGRSTQAGSDPPGCEAGQCADLG